MRAFQDAHLRGPVECQLGELVPMSCVLENTEAEFEGMKGCEKQRGLGHWSPSSTLCKCKASIQLLFFFLGRVVRLAGS